MFFEQSKEIKRCQKSKEIEIEKGVREGEKNVGLWTKPWGALKKNVGCLDYLNTCQNENDLFLVLSNWR